MANDDLSCCRGLVKMDANRFDQKVHELLQPESSVPFWVELKGGGQIWIREPVLAFGGGGASFIDR